jgi:hypothetical protein
MRLNDSVNPVLASTKLNGTSDKPVKQQQSSNKKKSAKSVASVDATAPLDTVADTNILQPMQSPQLFADEIGTAEETKSATQPDEANATKTPDETTQPGVGDTLIQSNESADITTPDKPSATVTSNVSDIITATAEHTTTAPPDTLSEADTTAVADDAKATRVSRKQSREELEDYKAEYLVPVKIGKRHTVVLDDDLWKELDYIVRRIGDGDANTTSFANAIIRNHIKDIRPKVEVWRKLYK